ncbi:enoyl-CoA hydratase [Halieaceae bacterium IMCC14734]|uniref:Enoyl-CoA hydratase n=2 Tax=Candidatus Litorirhabdus singularis TaxID=2518993 RepID=A0ABT3TET7_9GAMM|nr:enoyl-CoA hydratase [Candidatus Litorirhabdus singularis]
MQPDQFSDITYVRDSAGIVTLTLNTPQRKNALSGLTFHEIWWAAEHFKSDEDAHAMIITGAPDPDSDDATREAFSSGGYFSPDAFEGVPEAVMAEIDLSDIAQKKTVLQLFQCDKPIFAAVNGLAIGGAVTLVLAVADQVYMSEHAWMQLPFAKLGIAAELGSTFLLPRVLGFQKAKEVFFYPERIAAAQAVELGLAGKVLPHAELLDYTRERALQLIPPRGAGLAIREMKKAMHAPHVEALSEALDRENTALNTLFRSKDFTEGLSARMERRDAVFIGQ